MTSHYIVPSLFGFGALVAWDFVIEYGFRAKWYTHIYGRIQLAFKTIIAMLLSLVVINSFIPDYPGRDVIRYTLYSAFIGGLITLDVFLHIQLRRDSHERDDENNPDGTDKTVE